MISNPYIAIIVSGILTFICIFLLTLGIFYFIEKMSNRFDSNFFEDGTKHIVKYSLWMATAQLVFSFIKLYPQFVELINNSNL